MTPASRALAGFCNRNSPSPVLESLVDLARDKADAQIQRCMTVLRECCLLLGQSRVLKQHLKVAGRGSVAVTRTIQKPLHPSASLGRNFSPLSKPTALIVSAVAGEAILPFVN